MATLRIKEIAEANSRTAKSVMPAGGLRCDVEMEGHNTIIDEPPERGGTDQGATPLLHFRRPLLLVRQCKLLKLLSPCVLSLVK